MAVGRVVGVSAEIVAAGMNPAAIAVGAAQAADLHRFPLLVVEVG
jgi:hypothetical protein